MDYFVENNNIILNQKDFNLDQTLDCGQAFRWKKISNNVYEGYFFDKYLKIEQNGSNFTFFNTTENDFLNVWYDYFDFDTDYSELKKEFSEDETLSKACNFAGGIRLLKQNAWECLISFIISQNNNIPRIKGIINRLCEHYGKFPVSKNLINETPTSLEYLRSGFRAKYICDAVQKVHSGTTDLEKIKSMPIDEARKALCQIKGVGAKVSECVLLYGMYRTEAFPIDVWIKRVLETYYPNGFPEFKHKGIAQQYLFHYIRNIDE